MESTINQEFDNKDNNQGDMYMVNSLNKHWLKNIEIIGIYNGWIKQIEYNNEIKRNIDKFRWIN